MKGMLETVLLNDDSSSEPINFERMLAQQKRTDRIFAEIDKIIFQVYQFWEDLLIMPDRFETIFRQAIEAVGKITSLRQFAALHFKSSLDLKNLRIFIRFLNEIGFSITKELNKMFLEMNRSIDCFNAKMFKRSTAKNDSDLTQVAILIASMTALTSGVVVYASHLTEDIINYRPSQLIDKNFTQIMPYCYKVIHEKLVSRFYASPIQSNKVQSSIMVYVIDQNGYLVACSASLRLYPFLNNIPSFVSSPGCLLEQSRQNKRLRTCFDQL